MNHQHCICRSGNVVVDYNVCYNGQFQKISIPTAVHHRQLLGFLRAHGGGGEGVIFELDFQRHRGILATEIPKAWGDTCY